MEDGLFLDGGRRAFLKGCVFAGGAFALDAFASAPLGSGGSYSVSVLGDTHYDAEPASVYHANYKSSNPAQDPRVAEFQRNGEMWRDRCRRLLASSVELSKRRGSSMVLQLGDLIQGDCEDLEVHKKMLADCIAFFKSHYPENLPFLSVVGNHDYRGKYGEEAYHGFMEPYLGRLLKKQVKYPVISFRKGPDLWVFCHFRTRDMDALCDEIEKAGDVRYVFLATHGPFTFSDTRSWRWRLAGDVGSEAGRSRLYELLSRKRAIVLSGHTHTVVHWRHENKFGSYSEFTANTVWAREEQATAEPIHSKPEEYGSYRLGKITNKKEIDSYTKEIGFFRPGVKEYFYSHAAGHYLMTVKDSGVEMEFYPGASLENPRKFKLS